MNEKHHFTKKEIIHLLVFLPVFVILGMVLFLKPSITGFVVSEQTENLSINIWHTNGIIYVEESITFSSNLTNLTNITNIEDANCEIDVQSTVSDMEYSAGVYTYESSFSEAGSYNYEISCSLNQSDIILASSSIDISEEVVEIAEGIVSLGECDSDLVLRAIYIGGEAFCDKISTFRIDDNDGGDLPPTYWNFYDNATLILPDNLSTSSDLNRTLDNGISVYNWNDATCSSLGTYNVNVTFQNKTNSCYLNISLDLSSWQTNPALNINFTTIQNMTIGSSQTINVTINSSGDANATEISFQVSTSDSSVVDISGTSVSIDELENGSTTNKTITFTALTGGTINFTISSVIYKRTNGQQMDLFTPPPSSNFHINYNPALSQIPDITLNWNTNNETISLLDYYSDSDTYDAISNANFTITGNTNIAVDISPSYFLSVIPNTDWTGSENITIEVNDTYNMTANITLTVYVQNGSNDTTCDGIDEDGDTLLPDLAT